MNSSRIFSIRTKKDFEREALEVFRFQAENNPVYKEYIGNLGADPGTIRSIFRIPFLPIEFFKTHKVVSGFSGKLPAQHFLSSGTTGSDRSRHFVQDIALYEKSFRKGFELAYGDVKKYTILAVLPSYTENKNSSLIYMVKDLVKRSGKMDSGFYRVNDPKLLLLIEELSAKKKYVILFGVSFALLDLVLASSHSLLYSSVIVIETGGMKGRREEITREELHKTLCEKFGAKKIHSEYGMTELLSQAWSTGDGIFKCPPWMKVLVRDVNDPLGMMNGTAGALNIIDLANVNSCSFIATQDLGRVYRNGSFEVLGRMDNADLRGCNLLVQ